MTPEKVEQARKLNEIAKARGQTLAQMALLWVLRRPGVTSALIGASSVRPARREPRRAEGAGSLRRRARAHRGDPEVDGWRISPAAIFDRALTLLFEDVAWKKLAATSNPRPGVAAGTRSRHIPARVRRDVWLRDGGRCAFVAPGERRCTERAFLEFHHREPHAIGGEATAANISLYTS